MFHRYVIELAAKLLQVQRNLSVRRRICRRAHVLHVYVILFCDLFRDTAIILHGDGSPESHWLKKFRLLRIYYLFF